MSRFGEADTKAKFIDKMLLEREWTEDNIRREETLKDGRPDYVLRLSISSNTQPVPIAVIEAKAEKFTVKKSSKGLYQANRYAKLLNVPFIYLTNGHLFIEFDRFKRIISEPQPLEKFPTPDELQIRYYHYRQVIRRIKKIQIGGEELFREKKLDLLNLLDKSYGEVADVTQIYSDSREKFLNGT